MQKTCALHTFVGQDELLDLVKREHAKLGNSPHPVTKDAATKATSVDGNDKPREDADSKESEKTGSAL